MVTTIRAIAMKPTASSALGRPVMKPKYGFHRSDDAQQLQAPNSMNCRSLSLSTIAPAALPASNREAQCLIDPPLTRRIPWELTTPVDPKARVVAALRPNLGGWKQKSDLQHAVSVGRDFRTPLRPCRFSKDRFIKD
jgi:hypothetical protein